jgi:glutathione S-transferase
MYTLYVIPGSHACRAAILMLQHKRVPYRRVDLPTGTHPFLGRMLGFDTGGEKRVAGGRRPPALRTADRQATVPALAAGAERISTNRGIARFLDERHPEPELFPADPEQRTKVEEAERWGNETLQMAARRITLGWAVRNPGEVSRTADDGRMGFLLYRRGLPRRLLIPLIGRMTFAVDRETPDPIAELPSLLDRVDALIAEGVLGGERLNAADFMIAPSLALVLYRPDALALFEGRPALGLVDRLLPAPALQYPVHAMRA